VNTYDRIILIELAAILLAVYLYDRWVRKHG
jgi:hypothetical protein